jgi:tetratricopeptide (TPR) repeat protein
LGIFSHRQSSPAGLRASKARCAKGISAKVQSRGMRSLRSFVNLFGFFPTSLFVCILFGFARVASAQSTDSSEVQAYSEQAQRAMGQKDWAAAEQSLKKLEELEPRVAQVPANLGLVYYSQNRVFIAASAFERALELDPKLPKARLMLGLCDAELGRSSEAVKYLAPEFAHSSDDSATRLTGLALLRAYSDLGEDARAADISKRLLQRFPRDPEILFQTSRFYADRSYRLMKDLLALPADSPWTHYASAEVYASTGQYDAALTQYRTVAKMAPQLPGVHFQIGKVLLESSRDAKSITEAESEFEQELAVAPQDSAAEYELGEICRHRAELDKAVEHFSRALKYHAEFEEAHVGLARSLLSLRKPQEAMPHLVEAARLRPNDDVPHYLLASAYRELGQREKSTEELARFRVLRGSRNQAEVRPPGGSGVTPQALDPETVLQP